MEPMDLATAAPALSRRWMPAWPCPVRHLWGIHRRGPGDPTFRVDADGTLWRGLATPEGDAAVRLRARASEGVVEADAWGEGAAWVLDRLPSLLGADDDSSSFMPRHRFLLDAARRHPHLRVARDGLVMTALVPAILEQKVTGTEAQQGFRRLVRRFGRRAPGPHPDLWLPPAASELALLPSWAWLKLGVDSARSGTLLRAASVAPALERTLEGPLADADRRLRSVPGIGVWTSAEVRARAHGDPDAVSFGDAHVGHDIGWALTGNRVDDDGLLELLEPYRGHRLRVQLLVAAMGVHAPRRGPRLAPRTHLPR